MSLPGVILDVKAGPPPVQEKKCAKCGKVDEKIKRCRCRLVWYCNQECQKAHWPSHKLVCVQKSSSVEDIIAPYKQKFSQWKLYPTAKEIWTNFAKEMPPNIDDFFYDSYTAYCQGKGSKSALDLGCGTRQHSLHLLTQGWKVTALDFCTEVLKRVKEQAHELQMEKNLTFREGDINDYDFPDKHELILALDVLSYNDPNKLTTLLKKIHGALEENGLFMGTLYICPYPIPYILWWYFNDSKTVKDLLTALGFKIVFFDCQQRENYSSCRFVVQKVR